MTGEPENLVAACINAAETVPDPAQSVSVVTGFVTVGVSPGGPPSASARDCANAVDVGVADPIVEAELDRLAKLDLVAYERERKTAASKLDIRQQVLDKVIADRRSANAGCPPATGSGRALDLKTPEPWDDPVDGVVLLNEICSAIRRHVVVEPHEAEAITLWIVHAHAHDASAISPRLAITSPEKGCGKTTLLDVLAHLVPRPMFTSNTTTAAIFRLIEAAHPTLLIDEADTFMTQNDEMRGILNSGHRRSSAQVTRVVGDDFEPRAFSTWCPTAIALIGRLNPTLEDRSVGVRLKRRRADEQVEKFRATRPPPDLERLNRMAARWADDHLELLKQADPGIPVQLTNRAADNWEPLLAIADAVGGEWPARARSAAVGLSARLAEDDGSVKVTLLADIRAIFADRKQRALHSATLMKDLIDREGRPWAEFKKGKALTQASLARLLKEFNIEPKDVRIGPEVKKGYQLESFIDAFARYLPAETATPLQMAEIRASGGGVEPLHRSPCSTAALVGIPLKSAICSGVAAATAEEGPSDNSGDEGVQEFLI